MSAETPVPTCDKPMTSQVRKWDINSTVKCIAAQYKRQMDAVFTDRVKSTLVESEGQESEVELSQKEYKKIYHFFQSNKTIICLCTGLTFQDMDMRKFVFEGKDEQEQKRHNKLTLLAIYSACYEFLKKLDASNI